MSGDVPPEDLIQLRRDFVTAERRLAEIGGAMPPASVVAAGEAEVPEGQRAEWWAAQDECRRLAEEIHRHEWWATVENRNQARMRLRDAVGERDDLDQVG